MLLTTVCERKKTKRGVFNISGAAVRRRQLVRVLPVLPVLDQCDDVRFQIVDLMNDFLSIRMKGIPSHF